MFTKFERFENEVKSGRRHFETVTIRINNQQDIENWQGIFKDNSLEVSKIEFELENLNVKEPFYEVKDAIAIVKKINNLSSLTLITPVKEYLLTDLLEDPALANLNELEFSSIKTQYWSLLSKSFFEVDLVDYLKKNNNLKRLVITYAEQFELKNYPLLKEALKNHPQLIFFRNKNDGLKAQDLDLQQAFEEKQVKQVITTPGKIEKLIDEQLFRKAVDELRIVAGSNFVWADLREKRTRSWREVISKIDSQQKDWERLIQLSNNETLEFKNLEAKKSIVYFSMDLLKILKKIAYLEKNKTILNGSDANNLAEFWDNAPKKIKEIEDYLYINHEVIQIPDPSQFASFIQHWHTKLKHVPDLSSADFESSKYFIFYNNQLYIASPENLLKILHDLDPKLVHEEKFQLIDFSQGLQKPKWLPGESRAQSSKASAQNKNFYSEQRTGSSLTAENKTSIVENFILLLSQIDPSNMDQFLDNLLMEFSERQRTHFTANDENKWREQRSNFYRHQQLGYQLKREGKAYQNKEGCTKVNELIDEDLKSKKLENEINQLKLKLDELILQFIVIFYEEKEIWEAISSLAKKRILTAQTRSTVNKIHANNEISEDEKRLRYFFLLLTDSNRVEVKLFLEKYYHLNNKTLNNNYLAYLSSESNLSENYITVAEGIQTYLEKDAPHLSGYLKNSVSKEKSLALLDYAKAADQLLNENPGFFKKNLREEKQKEMDLLVALRKFHLGASSIFSLKQELIILNEKKRNNIYYTQKK